MNCVIGRVSFFYCCFVCDVFKILKNEIYVSPLDFLAIVFI